jgi:TRAP-type uncharacterized transport system substrate-binding protein
MGVVSSTPVPSPMERPLATRRGPASFRGLLQKVAVATLVIGLIGLLVSRIDVKHDLHRMRVRVLSGEPEGNYHAVVDRLGAIAAERSGTVENETSAGSLQNVRRLAAAARTCDAQFGLAQDGTPWSPGLSLIGRLAKPEAVLFLGRSGDTVQELADLRGLRIGVGPAGSGADRLARQMFALPDLAALNVTLSNHDVAAELELAGRGEIDLALVVMDQDAPLVEEWVARRGLQIASFTHIESIARRLPHLKTGHIGAGNYDAVRVVPRADKAVMKVETLVLSNGCASRVATIDFVGVIASAFPDFVRHNVDTPNTTGLPVASASRDYFANGGPELADQYVPWLVDVMPPANWAYVVMAVSLLFNAMGFGHRFRLWRIDASRVKLEAELGHVFPPATTLGDIQRTRPEGGLARKEAIEQIDHVVTELEALALRSRRYSLSVLVPMGQEMAYRYQEGVIYDTLSVLRDFRRRCEEAAEASTRSPAGPTGAAPG